MLLLATNVDGFHVRHNFGRSSSELWLESDRHEDHDVHTLRPNSTYREVHKHVTSDIRILHITDSHISLSNSKEPLSTRMFSAFAHVHDSKSGADSTPQGEFLKLMDMAKAERVDLLALGGDMINFPAAGDVEWVLEKILSTGIPFVYTAGNHDWHLEGASGDATYDAQRIPELKKTFWPLFKHSVTGSAAELFGIIHVKGIDIIFIDNSNYQISNEQLSFFRKQLQDRSHKTPIVLLLHIPLALPGMKLPPKLTCGHPAWGGAVDDLSEVEGRPKWPAKGNLQSTKDFLELVQQHAAPSGRIVAILTGHTHHDEVTHLACDNSNEHCWMGRDAAKGDSANESTRTARGAIQYTTEAALSGGYRLLTVRGEVAPSTVLMSQTYANNNFLSKAYI